MSDSIFDSFPTVASADAAGPGNLELGAFSISLNVPDLPPSRAFYEKLGFVSVAGDGERDLILKNGESTIGLFHGMLERNVLTFNPGLTNRVERLESFTDVREVEKHLDAQGVELATRPEAGSTGAASITLTDPDGNPILIDQFF